MRRCPFIESHCVMHPRRGSWVQLTTPYADVRIRKEADSRN